MISVFYLRTNRHEVGQIGHCIKAGGEGLMVVKTVYTLNFVHKSVILLENN